MIIMISAGYLLGVTGGAALFLRAGWGLYLVAAWWRWGMPALRKAALSPAATSRTGALTVPFAPCGSRTPH